MIQTIVVGGGCFWCVEAVFQRVKGIKLVVSGYAGGDDADPNYHSVSRGKTGHAEVVKLEFESDIITLSEVLDIFLHLHNPTTLNRQGADVGTQYRSIILYSSEEENQVAQEAINIAAKDWADPIVTQVEKLTEFYPAEDYHQNYFNNHESEGYCQIVISPKLSALKAKYFDYST